MSVELDEHGYPTAISDTGERAPETGHRLVEEILETWQINDEWWRAPISRRCVEVVLEGGAHVVVFEDLTTGTWYLQMP